MRNCMYKTCIKATYKLGGGTRNSGDQITMLVFHLLKDPWERAQSQMSLSKLMN